MASCEGWWVEQAKAPTVSGHSERDHHLIVNVSGQKSTMWSKVWRKELGVPQAVCGRIWMQGHMRLRGSKRNVLRSALIVVGGVFGAADGRLRGVGSRNGIK